MITAVRLGRKKKSEEEKAKQVKYNISFEPGLYAVALEVAQSREQSFPQYIRTLLKEDLKSRGKWPV